MKLSRNCECCVSAYATGKDYGSYWCQIPLLDEDGIIIPPKGLCEFCNPNNQWYNHRPDHFRKSCQV